MNSNTYDVIVMGGGPAGSSAAGILAREGRSVVLFEKEQFPRHHIGESLMTDTFWTFQRMGLLEKLKASPFTRKYSVQFANPAGKESRPFYFFEANHHESAVTWQVTRALFDQMLIEHAAEQGAAVHQQAQVKRVLFEGDKAVGVEVQMADGSLQQFHAKVVVDATGQTAMLSNKFRWRQRDPKLKKAVLYTYFKGAMREPDLNGGATLVLRTEVGSNGWFWYIPLENDVTSVGIVADPEYLVKGRGQDLAKIFQEEVEKCEPCRRRVEGAERVDKIYSILDYSYRSKQNSGDGFILIGDAYGFLDPIYSSGVLLALKMAELAADAIHDAFKHDDFSGARLGQFQYKLDKGIESMRKLVYAFYNEGFSFSQFLRKYPDQRVNVIELLIGNVFKEGVDDVYEPMSDFAEIPPPLWEQIAQREPGGESLLMTDETMSAQYRYYDDLAKASTQAGD
ncbi:MAG TPA: NAD(P)/FAD-dependent oxidoreductase [Blastocatellia bacterium]|nr:NAD(P)/FAD-dependent oxidoreductase [Blastocatellia bacterium]HMV85380.1 NAD(P)/FAD-dependent oxidoreductase [Blastocatellia bacterium]HMZ18366.1 NAD(P)/FAD-dependent oxidoreductase [Blastocatellia bacterium]HNG30061.1 NAD(P)/FAD-dependent oxidoreductase [Blastocatellia bacterium]